MAGTGGHVQTDERPLHLCSSQGQKNKNSALRSEISPTFVSRISGQGCDRCWFFPMAGLSMTFSPKFVKPYAHLNVNVLQAFWQDEGGN